MYEQQTPFRIGDFVLMSNFLNQFAYKAVLGGLFGMWIVILNSRENKNIFLQILKA